jgi:group I intron endonuclease
MTIGIYKIEQKDNHKVYIGQSVNIERRWRRHINTSFNENSRDGNTEFHRSIQKNSITAFNWDIVEVCSIEELNDKEKFWIKEYNSITPYGYNYTYGGNQTAGFQKLNDETLNQIIYDLQNTKQTGKEIAIKFGISHQMVYEIKNGKSWYKEELNYPLRMNLHNEVKNKISYCEYCGNEKSINAHMCKECSDIYQQTVERPEPLDLMEMIFNEGFAAVGRKYSVSDNTIRKWCIKYGLPSKIKEVKQWWNDYNGVILKQKRKVTKGSVVQVDIQTNEIIAIYKSAMDAARALGNEDYNKHISSVCSGSRETAYGYIWKRVVVE